VTRAPPTVEPPINCTPAAPADAAESPGWELIRQWRRATRAVKIGALILTGILFAIIVLEVARYYDTFASIHWSVGALYLLVVGALLGALVGVPAWRFVRLPAVVRPPDVHLDQANLTLDGLSARARFIVRYCKTMRRNPELTDKLPEIERAITDAEALHKRIKASSPADLAPLAAEVKAFERQRVDPLLRALDEKVDAYIRREAINVGIGTTVSLNGTLDALLVLWRNANMISRIGRYYYGRPNLRGSVLIMRDVVMAIVVARTVDDLSDAAGDLAGKVLGKLGGIVAGPLMDGTINALVTMKVGYLAKRRCRSFEAWDDRTACRVVSDVIRRVGREATGVVGELMGRAGRFGARAADAARSVAEYSGRTVVSFVRGLFGSAAVREAAEQA
jgi:uncharacterized membrane protein YcjF (UPF0283 family)